MRMVVVKQWKLYISYIVVIYSIVSFLEWFFWYREVHEHPNNEKKMPSYHWLKPTYFHSTTVGIHSGNNWYLVILSLSRFFFFVWKIFTPQIRVVRLCVFPLADGTCSGNPICTLSDRSVHQKKDIGKYSSMKIFYKFFDILYCNSFHFNLPNF